MGKCGAQPLRPTNLRDGVAQNLGNLVKDYTPTYRGFDTFTGYYAAALKDYWYHGSPQGRKGCNGTCADPGTSPSCASPTDLSNSSGPTIAPADASWVNGTYDEVVFTREAVRLISGADPAKGFYMYLACASPHLSRLRDFASMLPIPNRQHAH